MSSELVDTPTALLANCQLNLAFALQVYSAVEKSDIHRSFDKKINLDTGGIGVNFELDWATREKDDALGVAKNIVYQTVGTLFICTYEEWLKNSTTTDADLKNIIEVFRHTRHCFAHGPFNPKWEIRNLRDRRDINISSVEVSWMGSTLSGQYFKPSDVGGYEGIIRMLNRLKVLL